MKGILTRSIWALLVVVAFAATPAAAQTQQKGSVDDLLVKGIAFMGSNDLPKAIEVLKQALEIDPSSIATINNLGLAYNTARRYQDAVDCLMRAIRLGYESAMIYGNLGVAYTGLQRIPDAVDAYKRAIQLEPDSALAHYNLGSIYGRSGRCAEAIEELKEAARLDPNSASICINLGTIYKLSGRIEESLETFREAVRRWPNHPAANFALGSAYYQQGRYQEAVAALEKPIECCKEFCELYMTRGFSYLFLRQGEDAANDAWTCLKLNGWRNRRSLYMALVGHFGFRMAGRQQSASEIVEEAAQSADTLAWPFPVVRYLRREIKSEDLLALAGNNDQRTEAHAYIGLDLLLSGFSPEALIHFRWVSQYGNPSYYEYHLAQVEIRQMEGRSPER
jgi:tetratricopeptide (TPR) repeat protein